jgi:DeoR/GlpR family transcriptional regulator of sugar metabolism
VSQSLRYHGARDRRKWILSTLYTVGFLSIADLARRLGVSHMTVRRDLSILQATGEVRVVRGGVSLAPAALHGHLFPDKGNADVLRLIAARAAQFIGVADTIAVGAGAATYELARALPETFRGTIVTPSLPVLEMFADRTARARVIALGGELVTMRQTFAGPVAVKALNGLRVKTSFLSATAVDARGVHSPTSDEASVDAALAAAAGRLVLLAEHEAFARNARSFAVPLQRGATVVTDDTPPQGVLAALSRAGMRTIVVRA